MDPQVVKAAAIASCVAFAAWVSYRSHRRGARPAHTAGVQESTTSGMVELVQPAVPASSPPPAAASDNSAPSLVFVEGKAQLPCSKAALVRPRRDWPHLPPFILPTERVNADHPDIIKTARSIVAGCTTIRGAAEAIRTFVARQVVYSFQDKSDRASDTLMKMEGMCTNKCTLQVAMLRSLGIPAGYCIVHIYKTVYKDSVFEELYDLVSDVTVHVFCCVFIPEEGRFLRFDATDTIDNLLWVQVDTGETQMHPQWLAGPFGHVQSNIDHLLSMPGGGRLSKELLARQNKRFRQQHVVKHGPA